nr:CopD family protein [Pararoseomonas indoligenes]
MLLCFATVTGAWAHASLVEANPPDGATLQGSPPSLALRFDEEVRLLDLHLVGPNGPVTLAGVAHGVGDLLSARLPPDLPNGTYLASWRIVSADGHPVGGSLAFGVRAAPVTRSAPSDDAGTAWSTAGEVLRFLFYVAFALGAGGALFRALVQEVGRGERRGMAAAALGGVVLALLTLPVQGGAMLAAPFPSGLSDPGMIVAASTSTVFLRCLVAAAGMALVATSLIVAGKVARAAGVLGTVIAAVGLSLSGHAAAGGAAMQALLAAHALVAAYWLGAFWPLLVLLAREGSRASPAVRRFAALAIPAVAVLLVSGAIQALRHMPAWDALVTTTYGQLVLAKILGASLLLILAAVNHLRLTPALPTQGPAALSRSIKAEGLIGLAVLGITAVLSATSPHAAQTGDAGHVHAVHRHKEGTERNATARVSGWTVHLLVSPGLTGSNRITLRLERDGHPEGPAEVWLELSQEGAGVVGLRRRMSPTQPGTFVHEGPELAIPGPWKARVELLVSDFEQISAFLEFDVAAGR